MDRKPVKRTVQLILLILIVIIIVSGLGISYYQTIEGITGGLLSKNLSFQIHTYLFLPFLFILLIHIFFSWLWPKKS
ncbi:hypothetical protein [Methanobacterium subterraneum]|uniref:hypothetical protein n=1 Tax=Methanobacterium subterraneum TaxID=59277 RepID=UPI000C2CEA6D|nr:hypothetical protein [Methanobacterium subterraneum]